MTEERLGGSVCIGKEAGQWLTDEDYYLFFNSTNEDGTIHKKLEIRPNGDIYIDDEFKYQTGEDLNDILRRMAKVVIAVMRLECDRYIARIIELEKKVTQ